jgi:hypothetical protein
MPSDQPAIAAALAVILLAIVPGAAPSYAADQHISYVTTTGGGLACTAASPCGDIPTAIVSGGGITSGGNVQVICIDGTAATTVPYSQNLSNWIIDVDCPKGFSWGLSFDTASTNSALRFRHLIFKGPTGSLSEFSFQGSGTIIFEDCVFADAAGAALDIEPNGALNLVIKNSRISNSGSGILLKPATGGSINATLDRATITQSTGGGVKIDTTNGPVTMDVTDSVISKNAGNGINAVGNAGGQAIVSVKNSVIARNGAAGVQANGVNAGVLMANTLLDQNAAGATSIVSGGNIFTYSNNQVIGAAGSGFNHTAGLQ